VLDLSQLPRVSSTVLDGLCDLETELTGERVTVVYAALTDSVHAVARRWPWWMEVESQGRYFDTVDAAADRHRRNSG